MSPKKCRRSSCRESEGVPIGDADAPVQACTVTVQQNAAGVRGVPEIPFSIPQEWGPKGVESGSETASQEVDMI